MSGIVKNIMFSNESSFKRTSEILHKALSNSLKTLLHKNPEGIELEKFSKTFFQTFGYHLNVKEYECSDIIDLLHKFNHILHFKQISKDRTLVCLNETTCNVLTQEKKENKQFNDVLNNIKLALKINNGYIPIDELHIEYKYTVGNDLPIEELGFYSIHQLLSNQNELKVTTLPNTKVIVHLPDFKLNLAKFDPVSLGDIVHSEFQRTFSPDVSNRLICLLLNEFPNGLKLDEIAGAYVGLMNGKLSDVQPENYGYLSNEAMFRANPSVVSLYFKDNVSYVLYSDCLSVESELDLNKPFNCATVYDVYSVIDIKDLLKRNKSVNVMIGEVYSPSKFWILIHKDKYFKTLQTLMDCMYYFYSTPIGDRYKISEKLCSGMLVAVYYESDRNYYRGYITSIMDLNTVKVFFVDYGTICRANRTSLRYIHKKFIQLPAQGIRATLHNLILPNSLKQWPRNYSKCLLNIIQDKILLANFISISGDAIVVDLFDKDNDELMCVKDIFLNQIALFSPEISSISLDVFEKSAFSQDLNKSNEASSRSDQNKNNEWGWTNSIYGKKNPNSSDLTLGIENKPTPTTRKNSDVGSFDEWQSTSRPSDNVSVTETNIDLNFNELSLSSSISKKYVTNHPLCTFDSSSVKNTVCNLSSDNIFLNEPNLENDKNLFGNMNESEKVYITTLDKYKSICLIDLNDELYIAHEELLKIFSNDSGFIEYFLKHRHSLLVLNLSHKSYPHIFEQLKLNGAIYAQSGEVGSVDISVYSVISISHFLEQIPVQNNIQIQTIKCHLLAFYSTWKNGQVNFPVKVNQVPPGFECVTKEELSSQNKKNNLDTVEKEYHSINLSKEKTHERSNDCNISMPNVQKEQLQTDFNQMMYSIDYNNNLNTSNISCPVKQNLKYIQPNTYAVQPVQPVQPILQYPTYIPTNLMTLPNQWNFASYNPNYVPYTNNYYNQLMIPPNMFYYNNGYRYRL